MGSLACSLTGVCAHHLPAWAMWWDLRPLGTDSIEADLCLGFVSKALFHLVPVWVMSFLVPWHLCGVLASWDCRLWRRALVCALLSARQGDCSAEGVTGVMCSTILALFLAGAQEPTEPKDYSSVKALHHLQLAYWPAENSPVALGAQKSS